jgi:hypothetical protein
MCCQIGDVMVLKINPTVKDVSGKRPVCVTKLILLRLHVV